MLRMHNSIWVLSLADDSSIVGFKNIHWFLLWSEFETFQQLGQFWPAPLLPIPVKDRVIEIENTLLLLVLGSEWFQEVSGGGDLGIPTQQGERRISYMCTQRSDDPMHCNAMTQNQR